MSAFFENTSLPLHKLWWYYVLAQKAFHDLSFPIRMKFVRNLQSQKTFDSQHKEVVSLLILQHTVPSYIRNSSFLVLRCCSNIRYKRLLLRSHVDVGNGNSEKKDPIDILSVLGDSCNINNNTVTITNAARIRKYDLTERNPVRLEHGYCDSGSSELLSGWIVIESSSRTNSSKKQL